MMGQFSFDENIIPDPTLSDAVQIPFDDVKLIEEDIFQATIIVESIGFESSRIRFGSRASKMNHFVKVKVAAPPIDQMRLFLSIQL